MVDTAVVPPSNVEIVREALALYEREGFAALIAKADPEIEIVSGGFNAGEWHGVEEGLAFYADWEEAWSNASYELTEIEEIDAETLITRVEMEMRGEGSGAGVTGTQWWLFGIRDGLISRWHLYLDRESALKAAKR